MRFQAALLDAVGQAVIATDPSGVVLYWNAAAEAMYGWGAEAAIGRDILELVATEQTKEQTAEIMEALGRGTSWSGEIGLQRADGTRVYAYVTDTPMYGPDGALAAVIGVSLDITAPHADDEERRRLASIVHASGDAIYTVDLEWVVTTWNVAAERLFGYAASEIVGTSVLILTPGDQQAAQAAAWESIAVGGPPVYAETERLRKDGSAVAVALSVSATFDDLGAIAGRSVIARDITSQREEQRLLARNTRLLNEAQTVAHVGSFELDGSGAMTWSDEHCRILGLPPGTEPAADLYRSLLHPDDALEVQALWVTAMTTGVGFVRSFRIIRPDGQERGVRSHVLAETGVDGAVARLVETLFDDTDRLQLEQERRTVEQRFLHAFDQAAVGIAIADVDGYPIDVNPALCTIFGRPAVELIGSQAGQFTHPGDKPLRESMLEVMASGGSSFDGDRRYLRPDGSVIWTSCHVSLLRDEHGKPQYFYAQISDITARKEMEDELVHQAHHDPLTGLPNRTLLMDRLEHALAGTRQRSSDLAVLFLNLDHLRLLNDTVGHDSGDAALVVAADCIADTLRPGDTVARLAGDDFVMVCEDVTTTEARVIAELVLQELAVPRDLGARTMGLAASIGVAMADATSTSASLIMASRAAMNRAKDRGRGRVDLYDEALRATAARRIATELELRRAMAAEELVVYYQPVVDGATATIVGAEALVRWQHPERGLVGPDSFIALAEESGLIVPIGAWVLETACRDLAGWRRTNDALSVSVNLSIRQMAEPDIVEMVQEVLARTGIPGNELCLELTESMWMDDVDYFGRTLARLKALGVRLSIDDFGTGYSSLSYLKRFPVDEVKVDRGFVDGLGTDAYDSALVTAIIAMAGALDLEVTAEGVETPEQLDELRRLGCQRAQGFYLARPMPAAELTSLLATTRTLPSLTTLLTERPRCLTAKLQS